MINGKPVVYAVEGAKNGCNFYRIKQPYSKLSGCDLFACATSSMVGSIDDQTAWTDGADVIVSQIATSEKFLDFIEDSRGKKKFIFDYDDNIFDVSPYNPSYQKHGVHEVIVEQEGRKVELWKDGVNGFDLEANRHRLNLFIRTLRAVDLVTTPSPRLAVLFRNMGARNVRVIKNFVDLDNWAPVKVERSDDVRIGYQGGWSHYEDWQVIRESIVDVMKAYPKAKLVIMGQHYDGILRQIEPERVEVRPWANVEIYPWVFKTLGIDIGIAPLEDNAFNVCKSEIKWVEYGALSVPCVASNVGPYAANIDHGKTGFLASDSGDWKRYLGSLIEDADLRKKVGSMARKKVESEYDINNGVSGYENAVRSLFNKEVLVLH